MTPPRIVAVLLAILLAALGATGARAQQEMLQNRSFETPVAPANGNNFYVSIANWTTRNVRSPPGTPPQPQPEPVNLIRPNGSYAGGPTTTPAGGGAQYFDVNSRSGEVYQSITLPSAGTITITGWFSLRDQRRTLGNLDAVADPDEDLWVEITNSAFTARHAISFVSFTTADAQFAWKQAPTVTTPVLPAGTYVFRANLPNDANLDLASAIFTPQLTVTKTSAAFSDPVNGTSSPKQIPGGITEYTITASTRPGVTPNQIYVVDVTPAGLDLVVANIAGANSGPAAFSAGNSNLAYAYTSLSSQTDRLYFSNNNGTTYTYSPTPNANGVDPAVTHVVVGPTGTMNANSSFTVRLRYRVE